MTVTATDTMYDIIGAARFLNVSEARVRTWLRRGELKGDLRQVGESSIKKWEIKESDLAAFRDNPATPDVARGTIRGAGRTWKVKLTFEQYKKFAPLFDAEGVSYVPAYSNTKSAPASTNGHAPDASAETSDTEDESV